MTRSDWEAMAGTHYSPEPNTGCWLWLSRSRDGRYGSLWADGKHRLAHRAAWESFNGAIPVGLQVDHLCRTTFCVNPDHMEVVTSKENTLRGKAPSAIQARATHCIRGHEFNPENTNYWRRRTCRICDRMRAATRKAKKVADGTWKPSKRR